MASPREKAGAPVWLKVSTERTCAHNRAEKLNILNGARQCICCGLGWIDAQGFWPQRNRARGRGGEAFKACGNTNRMAYNGDRALGSVLDDCIKHIERADEGRDEARLRRIVNRMRCTDLFSAAFIHHDDAV